MGHYHGAYKKEVQENKKRAFCIECKKKKYVKFMVEQPRQYEWRPKKYMCTTCG